MTVHQAVRDYVRGRNADISESEDNMHKARAFFYVCAGVFLFALSFHLGARSAAGQSAHVIEGVSWTNNGLYAAVDGELVQFDSSLGTVIGSNPLPVPGHVLETSGLDRVVYDNGDVYVYRGFPGTWVLTGNLAGGGPTPAVHSSFGALKSSYRGAPGAAQPAPQDH